MIVQSVSFVSMYAQHSDKGFALAEFVKRIDAQAQSIFDEMGSVNTKEVRLSIGAFLCQSLVVWLDHTRSVDVVCDETNNTPQHVDLEEVRVDILLDGKVPIALSYSKRAKVIAAAHEHFEVVKHSGAVYGIEVVCDKTNNSEADIAAGILNVALIGSDPWFVDSLLQSDAPVSSASSTPAPSESDSE